MVEKRHVGDEIQLLPCLVVRFEPGLEGTMVKKKIVGEGGKRKELTNHGLAQLSPRSPGRSRAIIVTLWFEESTYAVARPVIPAPMIPIGSSMLKMGTIV